MLKKIVKKATSARARPGTGPGRRRRRCPRSIEGEREREKEEEKGGRARRARKMHKNVPKNPVRIHIAVSRAADGREPAYICVYTFFLSLSLPL